MLQVIALGAAALGAVLWVTGHAKWGKRLAIGGAAVAVGSVAVYKFTGNVGWSEAFRVKLGGITKYL